MILCFDKFNVNTDTYELIYDGKARQVEPRVFDLIAHFASHPDQVFTRDALIETIWKGRIVSDATVATCVKNARKALGDTGERQIFIQTVRGRGFRFSGTVSQDQSNIKSKPGGVVSAVAENQRRGSSDDPTLMVCPFRCLSDDLEIHRVTNSLPLDLVTILTRIPLLRLSVQPDRDQIPETQPTTWQPPETSGVDLVVEGSVQEISGKLRANIQLSNAKTGYRLWAEAFNLTEPLAEAMNSFVASIVGKLEPQLHRAMYQSVCSNGAEPTARQLFLKASGLLVMQGWHHESFAEASPLLRQSAELDPEFALAHALLSLLTGFGTRIGLAADHDSAKAETIQAAEQALKLDSMDSTVLGYTGCSLADIGHLDRGETLLRNAIDINPANAQALVALGAVRIAQNDLPEAVELLSQGIEISPMDSRLSVWGALLAVALLLSGNTDAACDTARTACRRNDRTYLPRIALAGASLANSDKASSVSALAEARRIKPDLTPRQISAIVGPELCKGLMALEQAAAN